MSNGVIATGGDEGEGLLAQCNEWLSRYLCLVLAAIVVLVLVLCYMNLMSREKLSRYGCGETPQGAVSRGYITSGADVRHEQERSDIAHDYSSATASLFDSDEAAEGLVNEREPPVFNEVPKLVHTYYDKHYDPITKTWLHTEKEQMRARPGMNDWSHPMYSDYGTENAHMVAWRDRQVQRELASQDAYCRAMHRGDLAGADREYKDSPGLTQSQGFDHSEEALNSYLHGLGPSLH